MNTVTIQIGNTDDKLKQPEWAQYVADVMDEIDGAADAIHFSGAPANSMPWQNYAWVFTVTPRQAETLKKLLHTIRKQYGQDAVAWTEGRTEFI